MIKARRIQVLRGAAGLALHPGLWLAALLLGVFFYWNAAGYLFPQRHADSYSYIQAAEGRSLEQALANHRTPGYPLLIRWLQDEGRASFARRFQPIIVFQAVAYLGAVWLLFWGVWGYTGSRGLAFAFALPLPFAGAVRTLWNVGPDFLAAALIVVSVALLLRITGGRSRWWWIAAFGASLFCSYQLRPAGMFLVGFLPLAGVALHRAAGVVSPRRLARLGALLAAVTLVPFLTFAALRWVVVGHFGIVSFTGSNHAALAMCFLDERLARELPTELGPLARQVLKKRERMGWRPMGPQDDPRIWFDQYSDNIWKIGRRTARAAVLRAAGESSGEAAREARPFQVEQDAQLGVLAQAIVIRRPGLYAQWFRAALIYGLEQLGQDPWVLVPMALLVLSLPFAAWHVEVGRRRPMRTGALPRGERLGRLAGLAVVSVGYFGLYLSLVSLVSFPFDRYLTSMTLFLPGLVVALLFEVWRSVVAPEAARH